MPSLSSQTKLNDYIDRYYQAYFALDAAYDDWACANNIQSTSLFILNEISKQGLCTQRSLKERLGYSKQMLSYSLSQLEEDGYILREKAPHDRRVNLICFTPKGRKFTNRFVKKLQDAERAAFQDWSDEECEQIISSYEKMCHALIARLSEDAEKPISLAEK